MLDDRIDPSGRTAALAVGDVAAIALFVLAGELRHWSTETALARAPGTALPFYVGWALVAVTAGAYGAHARSTPRTAVVYAAAAWCGAAIIGHALRATRYFHGGFDAAFFLVSLVVGGALLAGWRGAFAYLVER